MDGGACNHDHPADYLEPAWAAASEGPLDAASLAAKLAPEATRDAAHLWQIAAAEAILGGLEPPPIELG